MSKVSFSMQELIPTVQYGNMTLGPVRVEIECDDDETSREAAMRQAINEVQKVMGEERDWIIEEVRRNRPS